MSSNFVLFPHHNFGRRGDWVLLEYKWCILCLKFRLDKPVRLLIRLLFGFACDSVIVLPFYSSRNFFFPNNAWFEETAGFHKSFTQTRQFFWTNYPWDPFVMLRWWWCRDFVKIMWHRCVGLSKNGSRKDCVSWHVCFVKLNVTRFTSMHIWNLDCQKQ